MNRYFSPEKISLNGLWDFLPLGHEPAPDATPPAEGWLPAAFHVPSMWTKTGHAWRLPGEAHFRRGAPPPELAEQAEYFSDCFEYPAAWDRVRSAWLRRSLRVAHPADRRRLLLVFEALGPVSEVFLNGRRLATHHDAFLPLVVDLTEALVDGDNELAVLIRPYPLHRGRTLTPCGNELTARLAGIWQDVCLVECGPQCVVDSTIRTSTRRRHIDLALRLRNHDATDAHVSVVASIHPWSADAVATTTAELTLPELVLDLPAGVDTDARWSLPWPRARWWAPEHPHLYWLQVVVSREGRVIDRFRERFGFREIWIEGPDLMLNDHPVHLASDWGHKAGLWAYTRGWNERWLDMVRDANMNHSRLHTHPHPRLVLDLADEKGVLITGETALHGSGNAQAVDHPAFWEAAERHLRAFLARDRNRPCLVLWSIENEMRFEREGAALVREQLPRLRRVAETEDPTRIAYHEGDSLLWDETAQPLISRHYGRLCSGLGWWKRDRPLHSGEMSLHHLAGPNVVIHLLGDAGWADYPAVLSAVAEDARHVIEAGRTIGVCAFGPWNLSALDNYRRETRAVRLDWPDETAPGLKPRVIPPHCAEFEFWKDGKGYSPSPGFAILARAFRPRALIDLSLRRSYLAGRRVTRTLHVVNDGPDTLAGLVSVSLRDASGAVVASASWPCEVPRGRRAAFTWSLAIPYPPGPYTCSASLASRSGAVLDSWEVPWLVRPDIFDRPAGAPPGRSLALVGGDASLRRALGRLGVEAVSVSGPAAALAAGHRVLLVGADAVESAEFWTRPVREFLAAGGRVVLLEQGVGCLPGAELQDRSVSAVFPRAARHPALRDLEPADLAWWGEDAYAQLEPDHRVARRLYRKTDGAALAPLLDSGEGTFGDGDLEYAALLENTPAGGGLLLACQLEISRRLDDLPAAQLLLRNLLDHAFSWAPPPPPRARAVSAGDDALACVAAARAGETVLVEGLCPETVAAWAAATGLPLAIAATGPIYQLVRAAEDEALLDGITHSDLCGVDNWIYGPETPPAIVAAHALVPCPGLEPLLVTPTRSLLRELHAHQGRTEFLRSHTVSRFLFEEMPAPAVGLGRVRVGAGRLLFWQFTAGDAERLRCGRARRTLRRNLGLLAHGNVLEGEAPRGSEGSPGYPRQIWVLAEDLDEAQLEALRDSTTRLPDPRLPETTLSLGPWRLIPTPEGVVRARDCGPGRPILLYTRLRSPRRRFGSDLNLGVPNPDTFTYCELVGDGRAQMTMDGYRFLPTDLSGGSGTVKDMSMDLGYNQSLLAWWPASPDSTLTIRWRNSLLQPETSFGFV